MNIVLIGYRCTGKSSIGRRLADILEWRFVDTDELIEQEAGLKIEDIVLKKGWDEFRRLERRVVEEVSSLDKSVISTGGGVVLDQRNIRDLQKNGWIVWLKASPEIIRERMLRDKESGFTRPTLTGKDPIDEIKEVLDKRTPFYKKAAHLVIETDNFSQEKLCDMILKRFQGIKDAR